MKRATKLSALILGAILFTGGPALAVKPGRNVNPNGFPSGDHYNLNIIGKKDGFNCPEQEVDEYGNPIYGNVVFIPEEGGGKIYMQSGKGNKFETITRLQVMDKCADDGDGATLQLPKNGGGYRVYARALGKPTGLPSIGLGPSLVAVKDENGTDLIYLGLVTDNGFETPYQSFSRTKGKSRAIDISGLFQWNGSVCYFSEPEGDYTTSSICCTATDVDTGECVEYGYVDTEFCADGSVPVTVYCKEYSNEWVFNIGEFVEYLWSTDNHGTKLLQVRFYPN